MRTTLNLIAQTDITDVTKSLISFMKEFKLTKFENDINSEIKISNILHFYEELEGYCAENIISNMDRFNSSMSPSDYSELEKLIISTYRVKSGEDLEDQLMHIKRMITRLCIRLLS